MTEQSNPTPSRSAKFKPTSVAEYISWQINLCGKKQLDIAKQAGFDKPNVITMIKQGKTKLPLEKISRFAKAIEVDPVHLFKMCLQEYLPETWVGIEKMFDQPVMTENEVEILKTIREANIDNPKIRNDEDRLRLIEAIETLKPDNAIND